MNWDYYPPNQRFEAKFHERHETAPDGWPSEANPLPEGTEPRQGYTSTTGAELNALREKLAPEMRARHHAAVALGHAHAERKRRETIDSECLLREGFEWRGKRFSLSVHAQLNLAHDAHAGDDEFPLHRRTIDGEVVELSRVDFADLYRTARVAIRAIRPKT